MEIPILTLNRENKETVLRYHPQMAMVEHLDYLPIIY